MIKDLASLIFDSMIIGFESIFIGKKVTQSHTEVYPPAGGLGGENQGYSVLLINEGEQYELNTPGLIFSYNIS